MRPGRRRGGWPRGRRGGWRAGSRGSARRGPAAGRPGSRRCGCASHSATKAGMPSRSILSARASSAARRSLRAAGSAMPGEGLSRTSRADDVGMRDREAERDPGAERVADDVGGRGAEAAEDRGQVVGRPLDGHAARVGGVGSAVARQVHDDDPERACERRGMTRPRRAAAREAMDQQQRRPRAARPRPPSGGRRRPAGSRPDRRRDDRGDLAMERDIAHAIGAQLEHLDPRAPDRPFDLRPEIPGPTTRCSPPNAVTIGAKSIPCGVPNSSSYRSGRPAPGMAATPGAGTRRCRRRRC